MGEKYSTGMKLFICIAKIMAAVGLILPTLLNILPIMTVIAALGIATLMSAALIYHFQTKEYKDIPATVIFLTMALLISYFKF